MRAALGILCLQCVLLTGTAPRTAVAAAPPPATPTAKAAVAVGAGRPGPNPSQPLSPQDLLFACPTTLDHIGRVVASVMVDGKGPFRFMDRPAMILGMDVLGTVNAFAIDFPHEEIAVDSRYGYDSAVRLPLG